MARGSLGTNSGGLGGPRWEGLVPEYSALGGLDLLVEGLVAIGFTGLGFGRPGLLGVRFGREFGGFGFEGLGFGGLFPPAGIRAGSSLKTKLVVCKERQTERAVRGSR